MNTINKTLPIELQDGFYLDKNKAQEYGLALSVNYLSSQPFPHIVIDNFLPADLIETIYSNFPAESNGAEINYEKGYKGLHKRQVDPNECNGYLRNLFNFFNSASILQFLEKLTSIDGLIADPYFIGGGFHEIKSGGLLGVHSDFRVNKKLHLERRLNAIIYLNKDWKKEYGGNLELWDSGMTTCLKQIEPIYNRCVIFNTDQDSNHGHPEPLSTPHDITRKSIALYYYTSSQKIYDEFSDHRTLYKARPKDKGIFRRLKNKLMKINSFGVSK